MQDDIYPEHMFYSPKFGIDLAEVEETNPYMFGKELATWLSGQLRQRGYDSEVVAEDWGWCVVCQRKPYTLFIGCLSALDDNLVERCEDPSSQAEILWRAIPVAERSIFQLTTSKEEMESGLAKLRADLGAVLKSEASVTFATDQQIDKWAAESEVLVEEKINNVYEPKPVSRWIAVPVGLLLLPILLISAVGAGSLLFDNPEGYEVIRPVVGTILLLLIFLLGTVAIRMITGKERPDGGLFSPAVLRGFAIVFFLLPAGGLFSGWYVDNPVLGIAQAITYFFIGGGLWRLARYRKDKAEKARDLVD